MTLRIALALAALSAPAAAAQSQLMESDCDRIEIPRAVVDALREVADRERTRLAATLRAEADRLAYLECLDDRDLPSEDVDGECEEP